MIVQHSDKYYLFIFIYFYLFIYLLFIYFQLLNILEFYIVKKYYYAIPLQLYNNKMMLQ